MIKKNLSFTICLLCIECVTPIVVLSVFFPLGDYWMSAKAWYAFAHVIKEYWSNWMRCAKMSVIINMITSNYILRFFFILKKHIAVRAHNNQRVCGMQIDDNGIIHIGWKRKINAFFCCCCYSNCTWSWFPVLQISRRKIWCETKEKWFSKFINRSQIAI